MSDYKAYNDLFFSRWAPFYDGLELVLTDIRRQALQQIDATDKSVLDVATGTGSLALELSETAKEVAGIDLSAEMLAIARKKNRSSNLSFLEMDAIKMKFDDESFDIVTIGLGLHDMPPDIRLLVLQEIKRVLKQDGKLYILEYDLPENEVAKSVFPPLINILESRYYLDFIKSDFEQLLKTSGFRVEGKSSYLFGFLRFLTLSK